MKLSISTQMGGKLKYIPSINSYCLHNSFCKQQYDNKKTVCHYCYSIYMVCTYRTNCIEPYRNNDTILSNRILQDTEIPVLNYGIFRYNSHGEIINDTHFINYCNIAKHNKICTFTLYTKRIDIIRSAYKHIPRNMILVYSSPILNKRSSLPRHFNKVFTVYTTDYYTEHDIKINCVGKCINCMKCYRKKDPDTFINELIKPLKKHIDTVRHKIKWT
jgi:polyferredoxin